MYELYSMYESLSIKKLISRAEEKWVSKSIIRHLKFFSTQNFYSIRSLIDYRKSHILGKGIASNQLADLYVSFSLKYPYRHRLTFD